MILEKYCLRVRGLPKRVFNICMYFIGNTIIVRKLKTYKFGQQHSFVKEMGHLTYTEYVLVILVNTFQGAVVVCGVHVKVTLMSESIILGVHFN